MGILSSEASTLKPKTWCWLLLRSGVCAYGGLLIPVLAARVQHCIFGGTVGCCRIFLLIIPGSRCCFCCGAVCWRFCNGFLQTYIRSLCILRRPFFLVRLSPRYLEDSCLFLC